jgi:hypothetical protein
MKKKYIIVISLTVILLIAGGVLLLKIQENYKITDKPKVVKGNLCSDICSEDDVKTYYEGIEDAKECKKIGGEPYTYYGWGEFHACLAK